jgi:uncharacterized protein (DUF433 family)
MGRRLRKRTQVSGGWREERWGLAAGEGGSPFDATLSCSGCGWRPQERGCFDAESSEVAGRAGEGVGERRPYGTGRGARLTGGAFDIAQGDLPDGKSESKLARGRGVGIHGFMLDWNDCPVVERLPDKVSGAWVFRGTRVPVRALFENLEAGAKVDDFLVWFEGVTRAQVDAVLEHASASLTTAK